MKLYSLFLLLVFILLIIFNFNWNEFDKNISFDNSYIKKNNTNIFFNQIKYYQPLPKEKWNKWYAYKLGEDWCDYYAENFCYVDPDPYQIFFDKEKRFWYHFICLHFIKLYTNLKIITSLVKDLKLFWPVKMNFFELCVKYTLQSNYLCWILHNYSVLNKKIFFFKSGIFAQDLDKNTEFGHMKSFFKVCWKLPMYIYLQWEKVFNDLVLYGLIIMFLNSIFLCFFMPYPLGTYPEYFSFFFWVVCFAPYTWIFSCFFIDHFILIFFLFLIYSYTLYYLINQYSNHNMFFNKKTRNFKILFLKFSFKKRNTLFFK